MNVNNCRESFLEDLISVEVYRSADCYIAVPPTIKVSTVPAPLLTAPPAIKTYIGEMDGYITMTDRPTLKISNSRSSAGEVYTHELQIPMALGREEAEAAIDQLQGADMIVVYQRTDGTRMISYGLPNTSMADIEETISPTLSVDVKLKLQSMSPLINVE